MLLRISSALLLASTILAQAQTITIHGTPLTAQVMKLAEPILKEEYGLEIRVGTEGGSSGGFLAVGSGTAQLGMTTKFLDSSDRAQFPACAFDEVQIGWQLLGIGVARNVWEGGVHSISRDQMVKVYEGDIRNWKELGGPDSLIKFYNPKRGRGTWELFATWLYKDQRLAPLGEKFETVVRYEDARDSVEFNVSSISVMPPQMADGNSIHILGLKEENGTIIGPTQATLASKKYPLAKPLMILSGRRFAGDSKRLVDFLVSPRGQALVKSVGFMPVGEAPPKAQPAPVASAAPAMPRNPSEPEWDWAKITAALPFSMPVMAGIGGGVFLAAIALFFARRSRRSRRSKAAE